MRKRRQSKGRPERGEDSSPIPERIRNRRARLGMTGAELAKRIGVSPSYVSLIESGAKVPSPGVAAKIARALRDSPELYQAWVYSYRQGGWRAALRRSQYWRAYSSDPSSLERVASGEDVLDLERVHADFMLEDTKVLSQPLELRSNRLLDAAEMESPEVALRRAAPEPEPRGFTLLEIPLLEDGADPGEGDEVDESRTVDTLFLDSRLFGAAVLRRPFAYRPGEGALLRVSPRIRPGDHVVLSSGVPRLRPGTIVAVRFRHEVVLARALLKKTALLLLPAPGAGDFDVIELGHGDRLQEIVVGHVVLTVRAW